jgi:flagellar hook-basal body complex protein FliE
MIDRIGSSFQPSPLQNRDQTISGAGSFQVPTQNPNAQNGKSFEAMVQGALSSISDVQQASDNKIQDLLSGKEVDIPGTMISLQEADITLRAVSSVRDKVVEAYNKLINMPI